MAYDSAIAQATINTTNIIPREFVAKEYINLLYDNIDFGEEISKQTHVTNGIIVQRKSVQKQVSSADQPILIKKTQRTVAMPATGILPYSIGVKKTPKFQCVELDPESLELKVNSNSTETAYKLDLAYVLIKHICAATEVLPGWAGFNTLLCKDVPDLSRVGYLPIINAWPTEYATIKAILERSKEIADKLELKYAVLVFDEAVYAKVQQVCWKEEIFCDRFVVRLGEFHTIMIYLFDILEDEAGNPEADMCIFNNAIIVDAMAAVQSIKGKWKTFGELAEATLNSLIRLARQWNCTH